MDAVPPQPGADRIVTLVPLGVYWKPKIYHLADIIALDTLQSEIILGAGSYNPDASPTYVPEMASALVERIIYDAFYTAYLTASTKGRETLEFGDREVRGVEILLNPNPLAVSFTRLEAGWGGS